MKVKSIVVFLFMGAVLSACGPVAPPQQAVDANGNPVAAQGMSAGTAGLLGAGAGYLLGRSASPAANPQVIQHKTVINKTIINTRPAPKSYRPAYRSYGSGRRR